VDELDLDVQAAQEIAAGLVVCTADIDADVAAAIRAAWSAEGIDPTKRRVRKRTSRAASDRLLREHPELVRALAQRYERVIAGELSDNGYLGLWMYYHRGDLLAASQDR
jgi:hypothetical protein